MTKEEKQLINEAKESLMFCYNLRYRDDFFYKDLEITNEIDECYFSISDIGILLCKFDNSIAVRIDWIDIIRGEYEDINCVRIFDVDRQVAFMNLSVKNTSNINRALYRVFQKSPEIIYFILRMKHLTLISLSDEPRISELIKEKQIVIDRLNSWKNFINNSLKGTTNE